MAKNISVSNLVFYELETIKKEMERDIGVTLSYSQVLESLITLFRERHNNL
jgi:predicted CopG family antitoxin